MKIPKQYFETVSRGKFGPSRIKKIYAKHVADALIENIRAACENNAKVICCSEYSYPALEQSYLKNNLSQLAVKYKNWIVAGSHAEAEKNESACSKAPIFGPTQTDLFEQYKNTKGKLEGRFENINIPKEPTVKVFHTEYGNIVVLICSDATFTNTLSNLVVLNSTNNLYEAVDLALIPSYCDESPKLHWDCQSISQTAQMSVIYVNDNSFGDQCKVYVCGKDKSRYLKPLNSVQRGTGTVHLYKINLAHLRNERITYFNRTKYEMISK